MALAELNPDSPHLLSLIFFVLEGTFMQSGSPLPEVREQETNNFTVMGSLFISRFLDLNSSIEGLFKVF